MTLVSGARVDDDERVLVDVYLDGGWMPAPTACAGVVGMEVVAVGHAAPQRVVAAGCPPTALVDATAVAGARAVAARACHGDTTDGTDAGSVLSQGDAAHNGPAARALGTHRAPGSRSG